MEIGTIINQYKIISAIGKGGMGEVFLAQDTNLDRRVAIKFLNEEFAQDADKLNRFIQEAKAASALNHPNILTVYEIGEAEGKNYIATEFIEGETLREQLSPKRTLSLNQILEIGVQVAEALAAAHQAGIVHRDIKPENVMIRPDGYAKVLDFGLAKLSAPEGRNTAEPEDLTRKLVKTNLGVVMGTASYMSPEQARGKAIDARSDIFSFGVMMYELLAGQVPFRGETIMDVISAVLNLDPPPLQSIAPQLPHELIRIVHKALRKQRNERYQTARDLLTDLKDLRDQILLEAKLEQSAAPNKKESKFAAPSTERFSTGSAVIKDALLLTEFENTTGEAIFDQTLKTALAFSLTQSPFLDIVPDGKVRQTLRRMGRSPDERVTRELGEEICLRQNLKAFLTGTISNLGTVYVLTLEAINARTGESLGRELEQVNSREEILNALGKAAAGMREKLGESLSSIEKYDADEVTTHSLEALKFYTIGLEKAVLGQQLEAIPFLHKALEIDPQFAIAYAGLAVIYSNTNQWKLAAKMAVKAFQLRDTLSEIEKLRISYFHYKLVTGEIDKAIDTLELWRKTYPLSVAPFIALSDCQERIGQSEKAVSIIQEGLCLDATTALVYMNLAESLLSLGRYEEVKETCRQAFEKNMDGWMVHWVLFQTAFIEDDAAALEENLKWFDGRKDEYVSLDLQAGAAAFQGKWRTAQDLSRRAIDLAIRSNAQEIAAQYAAEQALRIVFWSAGSDLPKSDDVQLKTVLKTQTNKALNLERTKEVMSRAALALAVGGQAPEAESLSEELRSERPKDTLLNELWLPMIRAAIDLQNSKAKDAIEELEVARRLEKAAEFYPQYLRGMAYLQLRKTNAAVGEFDKILNHRGEAPLSSVYPLAQLGKARAVKEKAEYEKFFEWWKGADNDMPALREAMKEFEGLK